MHGNRIRLLVIPTERVRSGCQGISTTSPTQISGYRIPLILIPCNTVWSTFEKDSNDFLCSIKAVLVAKMKGVQRSLKGHTEERMNQVTELYWSHGGFWRRLLCVVDIFYLLKYLFLNAIMCFRFLLCKLSKLARTPNVCIFKGKYFLKAK